jgi:ATP-binding cassette subfamily C (CFTR/MRP) protein 1
MQNLKISERHPILDNVNLAISSGSITIVTGPVGSGKSTLLRALLGEVTPMYGSIDLSSRKIAYCSQKPWIPRGTIKEVIHGMTSQVDDIWYDKVKEICCLAHDLAHSQMVTRPRSAARVSTSQVDSGRG